MKGIDKKGQNYSSMKDLTTAQSISKDKNFLKSVITPTNKSGASSHHFFRPMVDHTIYPYSTNAFYQQRPLKKNESSPMIQVNSEPNNVQSSSSPVKRNSVTANQQNAKHSIIEIQKSPKTMKQSYSQQSLFAFKRISTYQKLSDTIQAQ